PGVVMVIVPSCWAGRVSVTGALTVSVFDAGFVVVPLPDIVPPDQVPPLVSVTAPSPPSVPPLRVKALAETTPLSVSVPPETLSVPTALIGMPTLAVAPLKASVPVPLMLLPAPLIACVPEGKARIPGDVAVNEPVCVPSPASASVPAVTLTVPLLFSGGEIVLVPVPAVFLQLPLFAIAVLLVTLPSALMSNVPLLVSVPLLEIVRPEPS